MAECFEALAAIATTVGHPERAARLLGAADRLRTSIGAPLSPTQETDQGRALATARAKLGSTAFAKAWATGQASSLEEAVSEALSLTPPTNASARPSREALTARERQVAALVARGLDSRQLAAELVIAEGTARVHVEHILTKLGLHSRTQLAAWAVQHGLLDGPA
jgi:non-specific serine/threonine protein kinase